MGFKSRLPDSKALKLNQPAELILLSLFTSFAQKLYECTYCNLKHHARSVILKFYCTEESHGQIPRFWFSKSRVEFSETCNYNLNFMQFWFTWSMNYTLINPVLGVPKIQGYLSFLCSMSLQFKRGKNKVHNNTKQFRKSNTDNTGKKDLRKKDHL